MERDARRPSASVTDELLDDPRAFSFFQAIRLLRLRAGKCSGEGLEEFLRDDLRVRPQLSLGFPATDMVSIEESSGEGRTFSRIEATFLGLYGASSPLPTFYTEELLAEAAEDRSVTRDFIDILNNDFYIQFFRAWSRSRLMIKAVDERDSAWLVRLNCLLGLGHQETLAAVPEECRDIRHIGLLTQYPRSALGLRTLLKDALELDDVRIEQCVLRKVKIPADQRLLVGEQSNVLGERSWVGEELDDRSGKFAVIVSGLDAEKYHDLLPGNPGGRKLDNLVRSYLVEPFEFDVVLRLHPEQARTASVGEDSWSRLGYDTWLFSGERMASAEAGFANSGGNVRAVAQEHNTMQGERR